MKLRPRCFNGTALKKDITRFAPFWALYLIGGLMISQPVMSSFSVDRSSVANLVNDLSSFIGGFGTINFFYAMLVAQLVFGDMFNGKLCNALHAMPLRRESWFTAHLASGLLFSLVPNFILSLGILPYLREYWYTAFLWLLGMEMHYLFFFGLAAFSMHCTGNRFSAIVVYVILNFFSILVLWFVNSMYAPMLYGVVFHYENFLLFSPVIMLCIEPQYFSVTHLGECPCYDYNYAYAKEVSAHLTRWEGLGDSWGYLGILTVLGAVFLVLALVLYRKRNLESAGDFVAFQPMKPIFWVIFTLCAGGAMQFIGTEIMGLGLLGGYIFLALGLLCGYFVSQMFLARSIKVFQKRTFLYLGIFLVVFALSVVLTDLDALGVERYIPKTDRVEAVYVGGSDISYVQDLDKLEESSLKNAFIIRDPQKIDQARNIHQLLIQEGAGGGRDYKSIYVVYFLESGLRVTRRYETPVGSDACIAYWQLINRKEAIFGFDSLEALQSAALYAEGSTGKFQSAELQELLAAMWADAQQSNIINDSQYHRHAHKETNGPQISVRLYFQGNGGTYNQYYSIYPCCENTLRWVASHDFFSLITGYYPETAAASIRWMTFDQTFEVYDTAMIVKLLSLLQEDLKRGYASYGSSDFKDFIQLDVELSFGSTTLYLDADKSRVAEYWVQLHGPEGI